MDAPMPTVVITVVMPMGVTVGIPMAAATTVVTTSATTVATTATMMPCMSTTAGSTSPEGLRLWHQNWRQENQAADGEGENQLLLKKSQEHDIPPGRLNADRYLLCREFLQFDLLGTFDRDLLEDNVR